MRTSIKSRKAIKKGSPTHPISSSLPWRISLAKQGYFLSGNAKSKNKSYKIFVLHCDTLYICVMDRDNKTVNINLRVTEGTKEALVKLAENDRRTLSDF